MNGVERRNEVTYSGLTKADTDADAIGDLDVKVDDDRFIVQGRAVRLMFVR